jgi:cathepsin D
MLALSLATLLVLPVLPSRADPIHIDIVQRAPSNHGASFYHSVAEKIRAKYGYATASQQTRRGVHGVVRRGSTGNLGILNEVGFLALASFISHSFRTRTKMPATLVP